MPRSRWCSQFNQRALRVQLKAAGIEYVWLAALGCKRVASESASKQSESLPLYAAYLVTADGQEALQQLTNIARRHRMLILCAERDVKKCHRTIIADYYKQHGWRVEHI